MPSELKEPKKNGIMRQEMTPVWKCVYLLSQLRGREFREVVVCCLILKGSRIWYPRMRAKKEGKKIYRSLEVRSVGCEGPWDLEVREHTSTEDGRHEEIGSRSLDGLHFEEVEGIVICWKCTPFLLTSKQETCSLLTDRSGSGIWTGTSRTAGSCAAWTDPLPAQPL